MLSIDSYPHEFGSSPGLLHGPWKQSLVEKTVKCRVRPLFRQSMLHFQHQAAKGMNDAVKFIWQALLKATEMLELCY